MNQNGFKGNNYENSNSDKRSALMPAIASIEMEMAVLGAMLIDPQCVPYVQAVLKPKAFYRERHGWIADAIYTLVDNKEPLDSVVLFDYLERKGQLDEIGGPSYIVDLINSTPSSLSVVKYAKTVDEYYQRRQILAELTRGIEAVYDLDSNLVEVTDKVERGIFAVTASNQQTQYKHISEVLPGVLDAAEEAANNGTGLVGIPTGFAMLDRMLGGLRKSHYILISGATGMGKSAFALSVLGNVARLGKKVGIFSLEMNADEMATRFLAMESAVGSTNIANGRLDDYDWSVLLAAAENLRQRGIYIDDTPSIGFAELRSKARRMVLEDGVELLMLDYIQLMDSMDETKSMTREQQVATISRKVKALARELKVAIIVLAQINQEVDNRSDKRPMLGDIRESKAPSHDADEVLFVYREEYYTDDTDKQNIADILVRKSRHGSTGTVSLYFRKELTQFRDLEIRRTELDIDAPTQKVPTY